MLSRIIITIQRISTRKSNKLCFPVDSYLSIGNVIDHLNNKSQVAMDGVKKYWLQNSWARVIDFPQKWNNNLFICFTVHLEKLAIFKGKKKTNKHKDNFMKMLGSRKYAHTPHGGTVEFLVWEVQTKQSSLRGAGAVGTELIIITLMAIRSTFFGGEGEELS